MSREKAFKKIDLKIYIVFLVVIAIAFFNAVFSSYTILQSQKTTQEIVNNMNPSMEALSQLNLLVTKSRMLTTNWVYLPSNLSDKEAIKNMTQSDYAPLKNNLQSLMTKWPDQKMIANVNAVLIDYEKLTEHRELIMKRLNSFDDYQDPMKKFQAEEVLERVIIPQSESITSRLKSIILEQSVAAKQKQDQMLQQLNTLMAVVFSIAILIVSSLFFAAFVISRTFIVPVMRVREIILEMSKGRLPEYRMRIPKNAVGEMLIALKSLTESSKRISHFAEEIGKGNLDIPFKPLSIDDVHGHALLAMRKSIKEASVSESERAWINEGLARLNNIMRSNADDFNKLLDNIINLLAEYLNVQQAAIFLLNNDNMEEMHIQLGAHYALNNKILNCKRFELKEGLVGQSIASNRLIDIENISDPFFTIDMGIGQSTSCNLMIIPLATSGKVVGAIAVASLQSMSTKQKELMQKIAEPVAANLYNVRANLITTQLLEESRKQADELAAQEHELRTINYQLTEKSQELVKSEEELRIQQNELKQVNSILKEKARLLEENNIAIEDARQSLFFKAEQLEQSNKYKSAFLANMSHELRTPLNSILILAKILADNKNKTLNEKQIEQANVIYKSGSDLLELINDILDLSKVEAGKLELHSEIFEVNELCDDMKQLFTELANDKQIHFNVITAYPELELNTDKGRVEQIIKNLVSNALKFTNTGGTVTLLFEPSSSKTIYTNTSLSRYKNVLAIIVQDNGIGIAKEKQSLVFEAFKQADGSTSRSYGGTGLGLSICLELAQLLGGELQLQSEEGKGSTFTLYIPYDSNFENTVTVQKVLPSNSLTNQLNSSSKLTFDLLDDKDNLTEGDKKILIIEDDSVFAKMLVNKCHLHEMKAIVAGQGQEGLMYARIYHPDAIILDMRLPVMDGWTVMKEIKSDPLLKDIPVHVVSSLDKQINSQEMGAESFCRKPAGFKELDNLMSRISNHIYNKSRENILALGKESADMKTLLSNIQDSDSLIHCDHINEAVICLSKLNSNTEYKCIIIDHSTSLSEEEETQISSASAELNIPLIYLHGNPDECLRAVNKVLHENESNNEPEILITQQLQSAGDSTSGMEKKNELKGKTVLLADDDMRNIYSMTSTLENEGMTVIGAINGLEALEKLQENPSIDIILMDIMMPKMNGYETMAAIRRIESLINLPIIAVTAKAMNGDKEKCLESGASDYITKPINTSLLLSLMQSWLSK